MHAYPPEYDEEQVVDLSDRLKRMGSPLVGYWGEDGSLHAGLQYDDSGTLPKIGDLEWNDALSDKANALAAARAIHKVTKLQKRRWNRLWDILQGYKRPDVVVPTFAEFCATMNFPEGEFKWDQDEAGDAHVYNCGDSDCPIGWHRSYYTTSFAREDGKLSVTVHSGDEDGNWDFCDGFEEDNISEEQWREFYTVWLSEVSSHDYFRGWANYHLECAQSRSDPLAEFFKPEDGCNPVKHMDAATQNLKCLTKRRIR